MRTSSNRSDDTRLRSLINECGNIAESLRCLTYLIREEAEKPDCVREYVDCADERLSALWTLLKKEHAKLDAVSVDGQTEPGSLVK